jgi:hypothetical protein
MDEVVMPKLVKLYIKNVVIGFAIAAGFVAMLLWSASPATVFWRSFCCGS